MSREIVDAMRALAREKGIPEERLVAALEDALLSAYKKQPDSAKYARVELDSESGEYRVIELLVPEMLEAGLIVETIDEQSYEDPETGEWIEPTEIEIPGEKLAEHRDEIPEQDVTPDDFGRIAAQTAKQVILQRIREAERDMMYDEFADRVGEMVTGIVQQSDNRYTLLQLRDRVEALLPRSEQVFGERYDHNQRLKAVIKEVSQSAKGPSIIVSRRDPEVIRALFELEVPEIADGLVEITGVAREPGYRSKIAVVSHASGVDPVGACVGPRGSRVRMVVSELKGEKIDIIPFNDEPGRFIAKALSPAQVREVFIDDELRQATVIVPDEDLTKAIGREGQNVRLAARLTGWRIDIKKASDALAQAAAGGGSEPTADEDEEPIGDGRCSAVLTSGRRCPNAALPGSIFCGLPGHQALVRFGAVEVALLDDLPEEEIEALSDPDKSQEDVQDIVTRAEEAYAARVAEQGPIVPLDDEGEIEGAEGAVEELDAEQYEEAAADQPVDDAEIAADSEDPVADPEASDDAAGQEEDVPST
ncbi:MAG: transcription termination factor NusA [Patulibacter sp.]